MRRFRGFFSHSKLLSCLAAGLFWLAPGGVAKAAPPSVVVSIPPLHSLATMVMDGVAVPDLLLKGGASPHSYALRPSESRRLAGADLVIRGGDALEVFLRKPLRTLARSASILTVVDIDGLEKLALRDSGAWALGEKDRDHDHDHGHRHGHADDDIDPHVWLTTGNARKIATAIAARLAELDPPNAVTYRRNAVQADMQLSALAVELDARLAPVRRAPFIVLHDAWQYFEHQFRLNGVGAISVSPERPPGARRLVALRARMASAGAQCVFSEPQFPAAVVGTLVRGTTARTAVLDPLGAGLNPGVELYPRLMRDLAQTLVECLHSAPK